MATTKKLIFVLFRVMTTSKVDLCSIYKKKSKVFFNCANAFITLS